MRRSADFVFGIVSVRKKRRTLAPRTGLSMTRNRPKRALCGQSHGRAYAPTLTCPRTMIRTLKLWILSVLTILPSAHAQALSAFDFTNAAAANEWIADHDLAPL